MPALILIDIEGTLIETFAYLVDQLLYRLNRVPDKNYTAFLDLLDIRLFPPTAAGAEVDFWLSAPQPDTVVLPAGTEVTTAGGESDDEVVFATKTRLAEQMITRALPDLPAGRVWVAADEVYGRDGAFRGFLEDNHLPYAVTVPADQTSGSQPDTSGGGCRGRALAGRSRLR